jgi:hypothetical protein
VAPVLLLLVSVAATMTIRVQAAQTSRRPRIRGAMVRRSVVRRAVVRGPVAAVRLVLLVFLLVVFPTARIRAALV